MPLKYRVQPGDCIASIAFRHGFAPDTLWNADENEALRGVRKSPHVLCPGDEVTIPDLREKKADCVTARRHTFQRKGVPEKLDVRLAVDGHPRAGVPYRLVTRGVTVRGRTDAEGRLQQWISPDEKDAILILEPERPEDGDGDDEDGFGPPDPGRRLSSVGTAREEYRLCLGTLQPLDGEDGAGLRDRLAALGFLEGAAGEGALTLGIRRFQLAHSLTPTGLPDEPTMKKVEEIWRV